jgi:endoglycosylceramidase
MLRLTPGVLAAWLGLSACQAADELQPAELSSPRVRVEGTRLLDALGREVLLRGVNAGNRSKLPPYIPFAFHESGLPEQAGALPFEAAADAFFERLAAWGLNAVRLPFSWQGLEPAPGAWDEVYLARYLRLCEAAATHGLRVIVDFHQDVYASPFCGDGFPTWTLPEPVPEPPEDCAGWFLLSLDHPGVKAAFDRFWADQDGVRTAFEGMWRRVAREAWARPGVVAFEVINEPLPGTAREEDWAAGTLTDFYTRLSGVIQAEAPGAPVVFDAGAVSSATARTSQGRPEGQGLVFGPHFYDASVFMFDLWSGADLAAPMARLRAYGDAWEVPVLVGEFGARGRCQDGAGYLRSMFAALDAERLHAFAWEVSGDGLDWNQEDFNLLDAAGQETPRAAEVVRVYPAAVAGRLTSFSFEPARRTAVVEYHARAGGLTEIATPARLYPRGAGASLGGVAALAHHHAASERLLVLAHADGALRVDIYPL